MFAVLCFAGLFLASACVAQAIDSKWSVAASAKRCKQEL